MRFDCDLQIKALDITLDKLSANLISYHLGGKGLGYASLAPQFENSVCFQSILDLCIRVKGKYLHMSPVSILRNIL